MDANLPIIAPLWSSLRPLTIHHRITSESDTLRRVTDMIASNNPDLADYSPTLAVVVTVEDAEHSFQNIIVSVWYGKRGKGGRGPGVW